MLSISVRYFTGYAAAGRADDREAVEWPPHPARLFMALAAAHFTSRGGPAERAALAWLEQQAPPVISAGGHSARSRVLQYVPVNELGKNEAAVPVQSAPGLFRQRQPRSFPRAWLERETAYFTWPSAEPNSHFPALAALCSKVTRLGHASCLVHVAASADAAPEPPTLVPDQDGATDQLRVAVPGTLQLLEETYAAPAERETRHATVSSTHGYAPPRQPGPLLPSTVWRPELVIFALNRRSGPVRFLDAAATLQLTARLRQAVLSHLGPTAPESLSGHCGVARAERPHLAILALPFAGYQHADGRILGVAFALPYDLAPEDRASLLRALARLRQQGLALGPLGVWDLIAGADLQRETLRARSWTAAQTGASRWASVTPFVFDRHPRAKARAAYMEEAVRSVRESWERIRQEPAEVSVDLVPVSAHIGVPSSRDFPLMARKDGTRLRQSHAILHFSRPVMGPILLGAGRFRGYGLFRPLPESKP
ncbi:MAG TPA: type I-U CRISPR-associated protein Csb2 [Terriglobales bacterium]|nr:type I-U CRISPR-associated protein Csb2 [Stellaceae bacterium]HZT72148.1 type I-U CRISPR-associated protein Csb2 [Terriglobales bacterium]